MAPRPLMVRPSPLHLNPKLHPRLNTEIITHPEVAAHPLHINPATTPPNAQVAQLEPTHAWWEVWVYAHNVPMIAVCDADAEDRLHHEEDRPSGPRLGVTPERPRPTVAPSPKTRVVLWEPVYPKRPVSAEEAGDEFTQFLTEAVVGQPLNYQRVIMRPHRAVVVALSVVPHLVEPKRLHTIARVELIGVRQLRGYPLSLWVLD